MRRLLTVFFFSLLAACSAKPSLSEMEEQLRASLQADGVEEIFTFSNVEKLNGYQQSDRVYIADLRYTLTFNKGLEEIAEEIKASSKEEPLAAFGAGFGLVALQLQYGNFKAGDEIVQEDKITYIKTEQGWRIQEDSGL